MRVQYVHGMLERAKDAASLHLEEMPLEDIPVHIRDILQNHRDFSESRTFGQTGLGTPQEYEKLVVSEGDRTRTFEYFNKAICYMAKGKEEDKPVFQVFAHLMMQARAKNRRE